MAHARNWYSVTARSTSADVYIFDEIGAFGVTAKAFINDLRGLGGRAVTIHINSPGGDMFEALAIYNALDTYLGHVTAIVEGVAASAASFIAMAADLVVMPANSMLMIHDPHAAVAGGAASMHEGAKLLENLKASMVSAYAGKSGLSYDRVAALMSATTWMTAAEAKAMNFADEVREPVKVAASFDLSRFPNAPRPADTPNTIAELSASFWAGKGKAPASVPTDPEDVSDLIPEPITHAKAFANFHGRYAGRK